MYERMLNVLFVFVLCSSVYARTTTSKYSSFIVSIDPGHQMYANYTQEPVGPGSNTTKDCVSSGTKGEVSGPEHAVVLDVALRLHELLVKSGVNVLMTRVTENVNLCNTERADIANRAKSDLAVRLHCNAGSDHVSIMLHPANIKGWTDEIYEASKIAAAIVQEAYATVTGIPDGGLVERSDLSGFNWSDVPVILPEMLEMQNPDDDYLASTPEFRQVMAQGLCQGILNYLDTLIKYEL